MLNYFDDHGWLTTTVLPDRVTDIPLPTDALGAGMGWNFTGHQWMQMLLVPPTPPEVVPPPPATKLTKRAFQSRFPKSADGISTKYDLMSLFLSDDGYAAYLAVSGSALYSLRALIATGLNRLAASQYVDFSMSDSADFTGLLTQSFVPTVFRLSAAERTLLLSAPIADSEKYSG